MRRVLILNYEYPPIGGGAGVMTKYIAEGLAVKGVQVTVVTAFFTGEKETETAGNLTIHRIKSKRQHAFQSNPWEMYDWMRKAMQFFKNNANAPFDIAICNFSIPGGIVGQFLKKKYNIPYVIISHGHDIPFFYPRKMLMYHLPLYPIIYRVCKRAAAIISLTQKLKINADNLVGKIDSNHVIANGIDTGQFSIGSTNASAELTILFAGRLVAQKNPLLFVKALNLLKNKIKFKAYIVGDGVLYSQLEQYINANGLAEYVKLEGKVDYDKMPAYFANADVYVMTSTHEAMPMTLIEAACAGKYIISTPVSGTDELLHPGRNGSLINYDDYTALANELEACFAKKQQHKPLVDAECVSKIRNAFDINSIVNEYYNLIESVCKNN